MAIATHQKDKLQRIKTSIRQHPPGPRAMQANRVILWLGLAAALLLPGSAALSADRSSCERGLDAAENYRYAEALMHFQQAAEQGDRERGAISA